MKLFVEYEAKTSENDPVVLAGIFNDLDHYGRFEGLERTRPCYNGEKFKVVRSYQIPKGEYQKYQKALQ